MVSISLFFFFLPILLTLKKDFPATLPYQHYQPLPPKKDFPAPNLTYLTLTVFLSKEIQRFKTPIKKKKKKNGCDEMR